MVLPLGRLKSPLQQYNQLPLYTKQQNATKSTTNETVTFSSLGEILGNSIKNATSTILLIGGFVVIFSVLISILNQSQILSGLSNLVSPALSYIGIPSETVKPLLSGIVELTNGVSLLSNTTVTSYSVLLPLSAFLLGFGGFSVLLQVFSIISKNGLSIRKYAYGKLLQGILATFYTILALQFITF